MVFGCLLPSLSTHQVQHTSANRITTTEYRPVYRHEHNRFHSLLTAKAHWRSFVDSTETVSERRGHAILLIALVSRASELLELSGIRDWISIAQKSLDKLDEFGQAGAKVRKAKEKETTYSPPNVSAPLPVRFTPMF